MDSTNAETNNEQERQERQERCCYCEHLDFTGFCEKYERDCWEIQTCNDFELI